MASTSDIRNGLCINFNGAPYQIIEFLHVKPGKGPAFVRTKIKNLDTGRVLDNTFPSGAKIEEIRVEHRNYQFLYSDPEGYHFMNMDDYNQIMINKDLINAPQFLKDGMECQVLFHALATFWLLPVEVEPELRHVLQRTEHQLSCNENSASMALPAVCGMQSL